MRGKNIELVKIFGVFVSVILGLSGGVGEVFGAAPRWDFGYTGAVQTWTVPADGWYRVEVWGGSGALPVNSWGISMDNTNFRGIPEKDEGMGGLELRRTNVSCECGESFGVYYGVRVNQETVAGEYAGKIVYTVVGN